MNKISNNTAIQQVKDAGIILLPGNSNEEWATDWLRANDIDVPDFSGGHFTEYAKSQGQLYRRLRDYDIIDCLIRGEADVGFLGSDKYQEWQPPVDAQWVGKIPGLDFVLAADTRQAEFWLDTLAIDKFPRPIIPTSYPWWLGRCLLDMSWQAEPRYVSGKVEAFKYVSGLIADLRLSGRTLADNNLSELKVLSSVELGVVSRSQQPEL